MSGPHRFGLTVYYEDTDLAGIVYYANYLRFIERGRTEALAEYGVDQRRLKAETGLVFAVRRVVADYIRPARFGDRLTVVTDVTRVRAASVEILQEVMCGDVTMMRAEVTVVSMRPDEAEHERLARIPAEIRAILIQISREPAQDH